jgi:RNA polymerase primary sigma factor
VKTLPKAAMLDMETINMENHDPDDPVAVYIIEASKGEPLTNVEEAKLFQQMGRSGHWDKQGEKAARRLIESQLMLVVNLARKHAASGAPVLEMVQEGNVGLMNAVRTFAKNPDGDFSVHAAAFIEDAIKKYLNESK